MADAVPQPPRVIAVLREFGAGERARVYDAGLRRAWKGSRVHDDHSEEAKARRGREPEEHVHHVRRERHGHKNQKLAHGAVGYRDHTFQK